MKECLNWPKQRCIHSDMLLPARANSEHIKKRVRKARCKVIFFFSLALSPCYWQCAAGDFLTSQITSPLLCLMGSTWWLIALTSIVHPSYLILAVQKRRTQPKGENHPSFPHLIISVGSKHQRWEQWIIIKLSNSYLQYLWWFQRKFNQSIWDISLTTT